MRKIIVLAFVSLDGVIQAPGGPQEDTDGGFKYGGWVAPYFDERGGAIMHEQMTAPLDLLLGRTTYEIFASYWPTHERDWPGINSATKYVVSDTRTDSLWDNTVFIKDRESVFSAKAPCRRHTSSHTPSQRQVVSSSPVTSVPGR